MSLVDGATLLPSHEESSLDFLEHWRDVGALVALHKAQIQALIPLVRLRLPYWQVERDTKTVSTTDQLVWVARSW